MALELLSVFGTFENYTKCYKISYDPDSFCIAIRRRWQSLFRPKHFESTCDRALQFQARKCV